MKILQKISFEPKFHKVLVIWQHEYSSPDEFRIYFDYIYSFYGNTMPLIAINRAGTILQDNGKNSLRLFMVLYNCAAYKAFINCDAYKDI